jgi:hypothetical protein
LQAYQERIALEKPRVGSAAADGPTTPIVDGIDPLLSAIFSLSLPVSRIQRSEPYGFLLTPTVLGARSLLW